MSNINVLRVFKVGYFVCIIYIGIQCIFNGFLLRAYALKVFVPVNAIRK